MTLLLINRRALLTVAGGVGVTAALGLLMPVRANAIVPTPTMRGGANNYCAGAPVVDKIGRAGSG